MLYLIFKLDLSKFFLVMIREIILMILEMNVIVKVVEVVMNDLFLRYDLIEKICY